jgi:hypothetical protein
MSKTPLSGHSCKKGQKMDNEGRGILGDWQATGEEIRQAWERAAVAAMEEHRKTGVPVATWDWENGRVILIPADDLDIPNEHSLAGGPPPARKS